MMMSPDLRVLLKTERTYDQTVTLGGTVKKLAKLGSLTVVL